MLNRRLLLPGKASILVLIVLLGATLLANSGCADGCLFVGAAGSDSNFDESRAEFMSDFTPEECESEELFPYALAGECDDAASGNRVKFLVSANGFTYARRYFDFDSERTIAVYGAGDVVGPPCFGQYYWPRYVNCTNGMVTEVLCGTHYKVGDDFPGGE